MSIVGGLNLSILRTLIYILNPEAPSFIGSVVIRHVEEPGIMSFIFTIFCHIWHFVIGFNLAMNLTFVQISLIINSSTIIPFGIFEFNLQRKSFKTVAIIRTPQKMSLIFREIQILVQQYNQVFGCILVPMQTLLTQFVMFTTYLFSKYADKIDTSLKATMVIWTTIATLTWIVSLEVGGIISMYGEKVLLSWKYHKWENRQEKRYMSKFRKSCKPLMVQYGRTFVIRRITVLKYIRGLLKGVLRTLLTVGKN